MTAGLRYSPRHLPRGCSLPAPLWAIMTQPRPGRLAVDAPVPLARDFPGHLQHQLPQGLMRPWAARERGATGPG